MRFLFILFFAFFHTLSMGMVIEGFEDFGVVTTPVHVSEDVKATTLQPIAEAPNVLAISTGVTAKYRNANLKEITEVVKIAFTAATTNRIDPYLVIAVIAAESGFIRKAFNRSGATGLMQVMAKVHKAKIKGRNLFDPKVNLEVGVGILSDCFKLHTTKRRALGCYNGATTAKKIDSYYRKVTHKQNDIRTLANFLGAA